MKKQSYLFFALLLVQFCIAMDSDTKRSEYQQRRDQILLESYLVYSQKRLKELSEKEKDRLFITKSADLKEGILYEQARSLQAGLISSFTWFGTYAAAFFAWAEYADAFDTCKAEPRRTINIAACSVCGIAMCLVATGSTLVFCDACRRLRDGERQSEHFARVQQLKWGASKSE